MSISQERPFFIQRLIERFLLVSVDGTEVDQPPHAAVQAGFHHIARAIDIDALKLVPVVHADRDAAGEVIDNLCAAKGLLERSGVVQVGRGGFHIQPIQSAAVMMHQRTHRASL